MSEFLEDDARLASAHGYLLAWIPLLFDHVAKLTAAVERAGAQVDRVETLIRELRAEMITRGSL